MSKGKKRRSGRAPSARPQDTGLADETNQSTKRLKPVARNLFFINLIFLAAGQWMYDKQMLSETISNIVTVTGVILLLLSLWLQFGRKEDKGGPPGSRSRLK